MGRWRGEPEVSHSLRSRMMALAGWECQDCGETGRLEIHHKIPISKGGKTVAENLRCVCRRCHRKFHENQRAAENPTYRSRLEWRKFNERLT